VLDKDPKLSAKYLGDIHVVKMTLESTQLLCSAFYSNSNLTNIPYKLTHKNHPCAIWVRESKANFEWLLSHLEGLLAEYTLRYNKIHKTQKVIELLSKNLPSLPSYNITCFAQAMPEQYRNENDPVTAYRNYYINEKKHFAKYTKRGVPTWLM
jgi:hypothetical protein